MLKPELSPQEIATALAGLVGDDRVICPERVELLDPGHEDDNLDAGIVTTPSSADEVQEILTWCSAQGVAVVTHGGRTSLAGASRTHRGQLVLSTEKLNRIIEIDTAAGAAIVEPGVTLANLQAACAEHGLSPGIDLGARDSATIGGMLSTNAGGQQSFRYGVMRHRILGLEAVLGDGRLFSDLKKVSKSNEGYNLKQLFIGGEGTLGVVTRIAVALIPRDGPKASALSSCPDGASAVKAFERLRNAPDLALLTAEFMSAEYARATAEAREETILDFEEDQEAVFLLVDVPESQEDALSEVLATCFEVGEVANAILAKSENERERFWGIREDVFRVDAKLPHGFSYDISLPVSELAGYIDGLRGRLKAIREDLYLSVIGHIADGNLHLTATCGEEMPELEDAITDAINEGLAEVGGSFSAEHGIGTEKRRSLHMHVPATQIELMRSIKQLFDPAGIMNPGKVL